MLARALILFACLTVGAVAVANADRPESVQERSPLERFPMAFAEWTGVNEAPFEPKILAILGVDDYLTRAYFTADRKTAAGLYIGYYASQRQGDTMHSPLNCLPGAGWEPLSRSTMHLAVSRSPGAAPTEVGINRYVIQKGLDRQVVLYWYQSHGRVVASEYWGKFFLVKDAVQLNRTDGAMIRVIVPVSGGDAGEAAAEKAAVSFVQSLFPMLGDFLPS
jgi:EpsI family protein